VTSAGFMAAGLILVERFRAEGFGVEDFGAEGFGAEDFGAEGFGAEDFGAEGFGAEGGGCMRFGRLAAAPRRPALSSISHPPR
jgi:hypothetical protein